MISRRMPDRKTAFGAIEESLLWSAEQRAASLAATLAVDLTRDRCGSSVTDR
ncbi:hypothetical protein ACLBR5_18325 [Escherichia coli]